MSELMKFEPLSVKMYLADPKKLVYRFTKASAIVDVSWYGFIFWKRNPIMTLHINVNK